MNKTGTEDFPQFPPEVVGVQMVFNEHQFVPSTSLKPEGWSTNCMFLTLPEKLLDLNDLFEVVLVKIVEELGFPVH